MIDRICWKLLRMNSVLNELWDAESSCRRLASREWRLLSIRDAE